MSKKKKSVPETDASKSGDEKTLYQEFQEMPYSLDRVGQSIARFYRQRPAGMGRNEDQEPVTKPEKEPQIEKAPGKPDYQDKLSFEAIVIDHDLYKKTVRSIDLSGLTRNYSKAAANGVVKILAPGGIRQTFEGVFSTGKEFWHSHGFIIVQSRLKKSKRRAG